MLVLDELEALNKALFDFSKRNLFLQIKIKELYGLVEGLQDEKILEKLFLKSRFYRSEYGLETALQVAVFIKWSPPIDLTQSEKIYYTSPLFYKPCRIKRIRKIETNYHVETEEEVYHVNPLIRHYFEKIYDLVLPAYFADLDAGLEVVTRFFTTEKPEQKISINSVKWFDEHEEWQLIIRQAVGLFNYKKSALGADYKVLKSAPNETVIQLLSGEKNAEGGEISIDFQSVSFIDESQREAIQSALAGNIVIQGPPGTGKSHTIVALMAAFLSQGKNILFVSEKKSALDVVAKRLNEIGLGDLVAYFNTGKNQKKGFYAQLKRSWEKVSQPTFLAEQKTASISDHSTDLFSIYPSKLLEYREGIDTNLATLIQELFDGGWQASQLQLTGHLPELKVWRKALSFLEGFEEQMLPVFKVDCVGELLIVKLNPALFLEQNVMLSLEKRLLDLKANLHSISRIQTAYSLDLTIDDFTRLAITSSVLNMVDKVQMDLINVDAKKYKSFNVIAKKYDLIKTRLHQAVLANQKWTSKPSMSEINELADLISQAERNQQGSLLRRLRRNPAKLKTVFRDFHAGISDHTKLKLLEGLKLEFRLQGEFNELKVKLKHEYNINDPENEIDFIFKLRNKLNSVSQNDYVRILEHPLSQELILELSKIHPEIVKFNAQCRYLFQTDLPHSIADFENFLQNFIAHLPNLNHWLNELKMFVALPAVVRHFLEQNQHSIGQLNAALMYATLLDETRFEPNFNRLSGTYLTRICDDKKSSDDVLQGAEVNRIKQKISVAHNETELLLAKANYKLDADQKQKKAAYKVAKRTILHEINKQQRHLSIKTFFEDTRSFLTTIQPIWMMNPLTVSEFLPCESDLFDLVIFDESSQIPLEDAIPSIYRAKQLVVVGDSKQMPPSSFFANRADTKTILDQAEMNLKSHLLRWHYRSKHPDLIRFSNLEFYNGDLLCLPPVNDDSPFEYHFVNGVYEYGVNKIEAKVLAQYAAQLISTVEKKVLIMTFSQSQEMEIRSALKTYDLDDHPLLTIRNLENAQGMEADCVLLSFGYGKNDAGNFRLNFGPINQTNGANRLNVFFTRAIEKMVVFTSVKAADFGFSDNRGVQLLKDFLGFLENYQYQKNASTTAKNVDWVKNVLAQNSIQYSFYPIGQGLGLSAFVDSSKKRILLIDPGLERHDSFDVSALYVSLSTQFKQVKFLLTYDIWLNPIRVREEIECFFME